MDVAEMEALAKSVGASAFRGRQTARWVYRRCVHGFEQMTDLPKDLRQTLADNAVLYRAKILQECKSPDGTTKFLLEFEDHQTVEAVLLPYEKRVSVCVSTQVGCAAGCTFCATAIGGLIRDLGAGEIVDEVLTCQEQTSRRVSHVVYMGMGEPLLNYDNVVKSIRLLNDEVGIGMRHITVSTVGITPRIERLADEGLQITLAISLHAPNDELRRRLIPISEHYPLDGLIRACQAYTDQTSRRVTFEYLLIRDLNDSLEHARELAYLVRRSNLANVNLIPYNAVEGLGMSRPPQARVKAFRETLEKEGIAVTQRMERGHTISAACGQLKRRAY
jgi:23S rRNA (adenine2503-C2)-methyltransferase